MGTYINPGNENLKRSLNSEIFIDKSLILKRFCRLLNTNQHFICVSRPRRFGKTSVRDLMAAYFSKGCDSYSLFENLKIANEPCFKENLNKFNVITIDLGAFYSTAQDKKDILKNLKPDCILFHLHSPKDCHEISPCHDSVHILPVLPRKPWQYM